MLRHSRDPGQLNLLQDCAMHSTARLGQALACVRHRWAAGGRRIAVVEWCQGPRLLRAACRGLVRWLPLNPRALLVDSMCLACCPACSLTTREAETIRRSGIPVHALTGSHDGITAATSVALLAGSLGARSMRSVHGGHAGGVTGQGQ